MNSIWRAAAWALPIGLYIFFVAYFSQNLIIFDDYNMIGFPFLGVLDSSTIWAKLQAMFSQQNEYRFPILATLSLLQYELFGQLHFNYYPIYGLIGVLGILYLTVRAFRHEHKLNKLLPLAYILLPLHVYIIITWANASCQYLMAFFYVVLTIYLLLLPSRKATIGGFISSFLAVFSFGSGFLSLPLGFLILLVRRQYKLLGLWVLYVVLISFGYFHNYQKGDGLLKSSLATLTEAPANLIKGYLYVWGGWADITFSNHTFWYATVPAIAGAFTLAGLLYVMLASAVRLWQAGGVAKNFADAYVVFTGLLLLMVVGLIVLGRTRNNPEYITLVSNHRYYAFLALGLTYGSLLRFGWRWLMPISTLAAMLFFGWSFYRNSVAVSARAKTIATDTFNRYQNGLPHTHPYYNTIIEPMMAGIDSALAARRAYAFPATPLHRELHRFHTARPALAGQRQPQVSVSDSVLTIKASNVLGYGTKGTYFVLQSAQHTFAFEPERLTSDYRSPFRPNPAAEVVVTGPELHPGDYKLLVCEFDGRTGKYYSTPTVWQVKK